MNQIQQFAGGASKLPLQHEVDTAASDPATLVSTNPLDSDEARRELRQCEGWYAESMDGLAEAYALMTLDHAYYDNLQWTEEEKQQLLSRGQAPLVYNKCSMTVDWVTGTERRTRIDYRVSPKKKESVDSANVKTKLLKYQSDTNRIGWNRSRAFKDAAIGGLGWMETNVRGDMSQDIVLHAYVPWQYMRYDPYHRSLDLEDCRYLHRRKWLDLDYAITHFPAREEELRRSARSHLCADEEWSMEQMELPQAFRRYDSTGAEIVQRRWSSMTPMSGETGRLRVPVTETWFRQPKRVQRMWGLDHTGTQFDPADPAHQAAVAGGYASLSDAVTEEILVHIWIPGVTLYRGKSPFKHGNFPFTPVWAKRRDNDGVPYGLIRGIRDAQDDLNKRFSKMQWLLASNQMFHEEGAIDPDKMPEVRRNLARPNGTIELKSGALQNNRVKIERNLELADAQVQVIELNAAHIHDGSGVNREQMGRDSNATSGRAILAKQNEGSVNTAELFDNLRLAVQVDGGKLLSVAEQFMTLPMQIRVTGEGPKAAQDWVDINQPEFVDGAWQIKNDITKSDADFVVDQIDFRESVRAAQAEQMFEMIKQLPPEYQISLLDLAVEMTDMPQRNELVKRIRKISGQVDPDNENDPQAIADAQAREQQQQEEAQLQMRERMAKVGLDEAKQAEILAKAKNIGIDGKGKALDIARLVEILLPLAPAADRLYHGTTPETSNVQPAG